MSSTHTNTQARFAFSRGACINLAISGIFGAAGSGIALATGTDVVITAKQAALLGNMLTGAAAAAFLSDAGAEGTPPSTASYTCSGAVLTTAVTLTLTSQ